MRNLVFSCLFLLAGCADWPDVGGPSLSQDATGWPQLLPLDEVLRSGAVETAGADETADLQRRARALRAKAAILRGSATDLEDLRRRLNP